MDKRGSVELSLKNIIYFILIFLFVVAILAFILSIKGLLA